MDQKRTQWGSKIGFLMAAVGSAVGLGNIWGFPNKMGRHGGFAFLLVYLVLAVLIGVTIMVSELALGRKTGQGPIGAYSTASRYFRWVGWMGVIAPFLLLTFYSVLGAYCLQYMSLNLAELAMGIYSASGMTGADSFTSMITNPFGCVIFTLVYILVNVLIVQCGVTSGIEKFNKVGMPALFLMLAIIIVRSVTLEGAAEGLAFMFAPSFEPFSTVKGFISVLSSAGGQMFFSLSLAMGIMVTYGSYLPKEENLIRNSLSIIFFDTLMALMSGVAVLPAAFALGGSNAAIAGPKLLFITMQDVFSHMGSIGPLFGLVFYGLVAIAAISSSISLTEVLVTFVSDTRQRKNKSVNRRKITYAVCGLYTLGAILVAWDGLGANGLWVPFQNSLGVIGEFNDNWLDFFDCLSEGFLMPLGAFFTALMIGWEIGPKYILDEIKNDKFALYYTISVRFIIPAATLFILVGQIDTFFHLGIFG